MRILGVVLCLALGLCAIVPCSALAQVSEDYDAMIARGVSLREAGDDAGALRVFERAWTGSRRADARAQMGLAEAAVGRWLDADAHLREALGAAADPWIQRNRAALEETLAAAGHHIGQLEVLGNVRGAVVLVDGRNVGTLPMTSPARSVVGRATVEVRAPGFVTVSRIVELAAGTTTRESVDLVRSSAGEVSASRPNRSGSNGNRRVVAIVAAGLGAVVLGGGVVAGAAYESTVSDYQRRFDLPGSSPDRCQGADVVNDTTECRILVDRAGILQPLAYAGILAGGILLVAGIVAAIALPAGRESRTGDRSGIARRRWSCAVSIAHAGVVCGGVF